jgi:hypothetical protein
MTENPAKSLVLHDVFELQLDPENPRLPETMKSRSQPSLLENLKEHGVLDELANSFVDNGYFPTEPVIVLKKGLTVIEGNRRIATLKILLGDPDAEGLSFPEVEIADEKQADELRHIPCYVVDSRADVDAFLGFRHIGGLKMWGPEAKARFVVHQVDKVAADGTPKPFYAVGRQVGSNSQGMRSSYISLGILKWARDEFGLSSARTIIDRRFGVWQRLLSSSDLRNYIGFGDPVDYAEIQNAFRDLKKDRLREVLEDMIAPSPDEKPVLSDSRLATDYARVISSKRARDVLRRTRDLEAAKQVVDDENVPAKIRRLTISARVLLEGVQRAQMTEDLRLAIEDLHGVTKNMYALAHV